MKKSLRNLLFYSHVGALCLGIGFAGGKLIKAQQAQKQTRMQNIYASESLKVPTDYKDEMLAFLADEVTLHPHYEWKSHMGRPTLASYYIDTFPDTLNNASITKYEVPNPQFCIVHLRQIHSSPYMKKETYSLVNKTQKELYETITELHEHYGFFGLAIEGYAINKHTDTGERGAKPFTYFQPFYDAISKVTKKFEDETGIYARGAELLQAKEKRVYLLPSEYLKEREQGLRAQYINIPAVQQELIYERREFATIDCLTRSTEPLQFLFYGAGHDFKDNLITWNKLYPNKAAALIEITTPQVAKSDSLRGLNK